MGHERFEIQEIADSWDSSIHEDAETLLVVGSVLNNLSGYPHGMEQRLLSECKTTMSQVRALIKRLRECHDC